jgi:hypothetical protein
MLKNSHRPYSRYVEAEMFLRRLGGDSGGA